MKWNRQRHACRGRKTKVSLYVMAAVAAIAGTGTASFSQNDAAAPELSPKLDVAYVSKYVWRGIPQTSEGAVQPSLTFSHSSGLSYNFWASEDTDRSKVTEHDHTLNYSWGAGNVGMNAGFIYYAFPNTQYASTSEVYASAAFNAPFSPTVSVNYDVDEAKGYYASLSGGYTCPMPWVKGSSTSLSLSAKVSFSGASYNSFWFGKDKAALSDLYLSASVPIPVGKLSLTPSVSYSTILDSELRDGLSGMGLKSDNFVGALTMSCAF